MNKRVEKHTSSCKTRNVKLYATLCMVSLLIISSMLILSGCSTKRNISVYVEKPNVVKAPTRSQLMQLLDKVGVPVIQKNDEMVLVLSNEKLFRKQSDQLKAGGDRLLQVIALLIRDNQKVAVEVATYGDKSDKALAQKQMRYITQLLWLYGMDTRVVHTNYYSNAQLPWECGQLTQCTLIRYHYFPKVIPYN